MPDLEKRKWRSRFERRLLDAGAADSHEALGDRKTEIIAAMRGTVVEIGPGTGANMRYLADGVIGTLVLCGVDDPAGVVAEAHRILKPGGTYFFVEHVRADDGSGTRRAQRVMKRPHEWLLNGCRIDQDSGSILRSGPFDTVDFEEIDRGIGAVWCRRQIIGTATKGG